jgi:hypothetical protein
MAGSHHMLRKQHYTSVSESREVVMKKIIVMLAMIFVVTSVYSSQVYFLIENQNELMGGNTRSRASSNVPERLRALLDDMKNTDNSLRASINDIDRLIGKQWFTMAEFEQDKNVMLQIFRESLDGMSNLKDRLGALELELFNPEQLPFKNIYTNLNSAQTNLDSSYKALAQGRNGLAEARTKYANGKSNYEKIQPDLDNIINTVMNSVPYNPSTPPPVVNQPKEPEQPTDTINYNDINVQIFRKRIKSFDFDVVNPTTYEGKLVLKKAETVTHQMNSLDKWLYRQAIKGEQGYSFIIIKHEKHKYTICWWHVADEIVGIIEDIENIFK